MTANIEPTNIQPPKMEQPPTVKPTDTKIPQQPVGQVSDPQKVVKPMVGEAQKVENQKPIQRSANAQLAEQQRSRRVQWQLGMPEVQQPTQEQDQDQRMSQGALDVMRSNVRFEDEAEAIVRQTPDYLDQRNNFLARNASNKLKEKVKAWEEITMQWLDDLVMETVQGFGWQVDMENPDRPRTIEDIRNRLVQASWLDETQFIDKLNQGFNRRSQLPTMTPDQLTQMNVNWQLSSQDKQYISETNPQLYWQIIERENEENRKAKVNGVAPDIESFNRTRAENAQSIVSRQANQSIASQYESILNNWDIQEAREKGYDLTRQIQDIDNKIEGIEDDIKTEFPDATASFIQAEKTKRSKAFLQERDNVFDEYTVNKQKIADLTQDAERKFNISVQEQERINELEWKNFNMQYQMNKEVFETEWNVYNKEIDRAFEQQMMQQQRKYDLQDKQMEYAMRVEFEKQMSWLDFQNKKDLMTFENQASLKFLEQKMYTEQRYGKQFDFVKDWDWNLIMYNLNNPNDLKVISWWDVNLPSTWTSWWLIEWVKAQGKGSWRWNNSYTTDVRITDNDWDVDVKNWEIVPLPVWWIVESIRLAWDADKNPKGKQNVQVNIRTDDWHLVQFNHMNEQMYSLADQYVGKRFDKWSNILVWWNTWYVIPWAWWDGSHMDIMVRNNEWELLTWPEVYQYVMTNQMPQKTELTLADISKFNNSTFKPQDIKSEEERQLYNQFLEEKDQVFSNPNSSAEELMSMSRWGKKLTDSALKSLNSFTTVTSQMWDLTQQIQGMDTWPISWYLAGKNPYDVDAAVLKARLTSIVPSVARWVYQEVWVLTDADIRNYMNTLPNLTNTEEVNLAIVWMTLNTLKRGMETQIRTLASAGNDVSWFAGMYNQVERQVKEIEDNLGIRDQNDLTQIDYAEYVSSTDDVEGFLSSLWY